MGGTIMPYENISYCCDFCDKEFDSLDYAKEHESECSENPNDSEEKDEKEL